MIDPTVSLAFSMHSAPGRYAILLGSGVSSAAGIPTGWSITLDLVRKLAKAEGEDCGDEPETWYREKFGQSPSYSQLLNDLAKTPYDRREVLSSYIEANPNDPDTDARQPTAAHRAIAHIVRDRYVNVILTTNFDRLLEQALSAVNVEPIVLSRPEQIDGAPPLSHSKCTIVKLHGDYLDPSIRNTEGELEAYPEPLNALLDRIIDEYGLIVCGWSGDWDHALRAALERAKTRRFTTYWTSLGKPSPMARKLIEHRDAEDIEIDSADSFFTTVSERILALDEHAQQSPQSIEAQAATLKRYLSDTRFRIQLRELIDDEVAEAARMTSIEALPIEGIPINIASITTRIEAIKAACSKLMTLAVIGGAWGHEEHDDMWQEAIKMLGSRATGNGPYGLLDLERLPATMLLYALGLGALHTNRLRFLAELLATPLYSQLDRGDTRKAGTYLPAFFCTRHHAKGATLISGFEDRRFPMSDWLHDNMKEFARHCTRDESRYTMLFDKLELLLSAHFVFDPPRNFSDNFAPLGAFGYREETRVRILAEIEGSLSREGEGSSYVASRCFGATASDCEATLRKLDRIRRDSVHW